MRAAVKLIVMGGFGPELATNGGMEVGNPPTNWAACNTPETFDQYSGEHVGGSCSARVIDSTPSYGGFYRSFFTTFTIGATYRFSFWCKVASGTLTVEFLGTSFGPFTNTGWEFKEYYITANVDGSTLYFKNLSAAAAATFYIDDVSLQRVT